MAIPDEARDMMGVKKKIKEIPDLPGVYLLKDREDKILYIGKAISLKRRIRSYFYPQCGFSPRMAALISKIANIDFCLTGSELEALILESNLIKAKQPPYNVALKDDKNYPFLKITLKDDFPGLYLTRKFEADGSRYYGRYNAVRILKKGISFLKPIFGVRTCRRLPKSPCLDYHLGNCLAPCAGKISRDEYRKKVDELMLFLNGEKEELIKRLSSEMKEISRLRRYEDAARVRDRILALTHTVEKKRGLLGQLEELGLMLGLKSAPRIIEAFDISDIMGEDAVGSMVTFSGGLPAQARYKRFKIKEVFGMDDYGMLREVLRRRFGQLLKDREMPPDLVIIDGGKGHLSTARDELDRLEKKFPTGQTKLTAASARRAGFNLKDIPVIAIAKRFEHIYLKGKSEPLILDPASGALHLIMRIRDEAHRFAHSYHCLLRKKITRRSQLDAIPGIGPTRKMELMSYFKSVNQIRRASEEELAEVDFIDNKLARRIKEYLK